MHPPPIPDPPPLPTRPDQHGPEQTESTLKIASDISDYLTEALSPTNITQSLNKQQIQALLLQMNKLKDSLASNRNVEKILERLDRLERRPLVTVPTQSAPTWASITNTTKKNSSKTTKNNTLKVPSIPTNSEINEFKKARFVIRTPPGFTALDSASAPEITAKINNTLASIKATIDSQPIEVAGIARLPSKDLRIYTNTRTQARWLLNNKHQWTDLFCADLKTYPSQFPVILHAIPIHFDPSNPLHLQELGKQNRIDPNLIQSARWLGHPIKNGKKNGSLVLQLLNKEIAMKIEKSGLFLQNELYRGAHYVRSIPQCFRCWKLGHTAQWCKNNPLCNKCSGNHESNTCKSTATTATNCCICTTQEKTLSKKTVNTLDEKFAHPPWSEDCPKMKQDIQSRKRRRWNS